MKNISKENRGNSNEKDLFIIQNKLLFKKYHPIKAIGQGTFSTVYLALNTKTNNYVAIKAEKRNKDNVELLESEAFLLYSLRGFGIPEVLSYGRTKSHNILVMPLLGRSLLDIFILKNKPVNLNDISSVSIQILDRIEWVHSNNIVYRDIKPENFLFGHKDRDILYLIDFGLCRKYKSSKTGKHIPPKSLGKFTGTSRYASVYAMAGNEQSRRDDIESIGYMIIFFMKKKLPWQGIKGNSYKDCYHKLYLMKKHIKLEDLCKGLPKEIIDYMYYARYLKFEQEPDYNYLKNLFKIILKRSEITFDDYILSWCRNESMNNDNKDSNYKKNGSKKRKSSPQNRLYKKIQESIENKNKTSPNLDSKNGEINEKYLINSDNYYENSLKNKNELNSEISNTMKVMINKNINTINSGFNESTGIILNRINSDKNFNNNIISFKMHKNLKTNFSPDNKISHYLSLNRQISDRKIKNNINRENNFELKRIILPKNENKSRKIISISPIHRDEMQKLNNSINNNSNTNSSSIKYNKINQIKVANIKNSSIFKEKHNNYPQPKENIIYNTYNTYNTYNSYNMPKENSINNNISINNIYQNQPAEIHNYQNYKRIKKTDLNNNFNNNINQISDYVKLGGYLGKKNNQSLNDILPKNKVVENVKYNSIDIKPESISQHFSYRNHKHQIDKIYKKNNNSINKDDNNNYAAKILGYKDKLNKNNNNNVNANNNTYISNINCNSIANIKKQTNYNMKKEIINNLSTPKFVNKSESKIMDGNNNLKIMNVYKNNIKNTIDLNNKKINNINETNEYNLYEKRMNYNYPYINSIENINNKINECNNSSSIQNKPSSNYKLFHKAQITSYIYKNKRSSNEIATANSARSNMDNLNYLNTSNRPLNNKSYRILTPNPSKIKIIQNEKNSLKDNNKNITPLFVKMKPIIIKNHSLKVVNNSSSNKKREYSENVLIKNGYINYDNNYYENKYRTEDIDINYGENNNGNKLTRINKYKVLRNRAIQNNKL
jgi:serine/threonine protein kinase